MFFYVMLSFCVILLYHILCSVVVYLTVFSFTAVDHAPGARAARTHESPISVASLSRMHRVASALQGLCQQYLNINVPKYELPEGPSTIMVAT